MSDQVDFTGAGASQNALDLEHQLLAANFVVMGCGQLRHKHLPACLPQRLLDIMKKLEMADTVKPEQAMDQKDGVAGCRIPLHVPASFADACQWLVRATVKQACGSAMSEKSSVLKGNWTKSGTNFRFCLRG
jgi:hypothetical protein